MKYLLILIKYILCYEISTNINYILYYEISTNINYILCYEYILFILIKYIFTVDR